MNIFKLIDMYNTKSAGLDALTSRREAFSQLGNIGKKMAMAAVPFGMVAASTQKSYGANMPSVVEVLNFALLLEFLEAEYYIMGLDANGLIPAGKDRAIFEVFKKHEVDHVEFLKVAIDSLGGTPREKPTFDFTVGGMFETFKDYPTFMALAQAFEDTGVRAYKGQAANLIDNPGVLTAALQIHSVEARHASEVRRLRGLKGWITQDERGAGMPGETQPVYDGEDNLIQGGVDVRNVTSVGVDGITESFDEPLTMDEVLAIGSLFIVS